MPCAVTRPGRIALFVLACGSLAAATAHGQPAAPAPMATAYPFRFATHAPPAEGTTPRDVDLVVGLVVKGEARAYPVSLLWGESAHTVNDDLGRTSPRRRRPGDSSWTTPGSGVSSSPGGDRRGAATGSSGSRAAR